jgi:molybdopterin-guanine dinucleotide biosynthesis protein A
MPRSEQLQPLLSLIEIDEVLDAMDRAKMRDSMKRILRSVPYCIVDFTDSDRFRNVNSQEDLGG